MKIQQELSAAPLQGDKGAKGEGRIRKKIKRKGGGAEEED